MLFVVVELVDGFEVDVEVIAPLAAAAATATVLYVAHDEAFGDQVVSTATRSLLTDVGEFIKPPSPAPGVPVSLGTTTPLTAPPRSLGCDSSFSFSTCTLPSAPSHGALRPRGGAILDPAVANAGIAVYQSSYEGGRYGQLGAGNGIERHHMPADSTTDTTTYSGPAIQMTIPDHRQTRS